MHKFYERIESVFERHGSNRHRFCKKYGLNYQTLQTYWNTDKLPPGNVLEALAEEYHVSLDTLVLGRMPALVRTRNPHLSRLTLLLEQLSDEDLLRVEGAVRLLQSLELTNEDWAELEELPEDASAEAPAPLEPANETDLSQDADEPEVVGDLESAEDTDPAAPGSGT